MPTLLEKYEYWDVYYELICDLFRFARDNITEEGLCDNGPCQIFYKGIVRIVIILIHDFSNFLSAFSLQLCLHIPEKYIQIRNIMLSAYPKELKFRSPKAISNREELEKESNIANLPKYYKLKFDKPKYSQLISMFQNNDKALRQKLEGIFIITQHNQMKIYKFSFYISHGLKSVNSVLPTAENCLS